MRRPGGCITWNGPFSQVERDTFTCAHCNRIVIVQPKAAADECGGFCRCCMKPICVPCTSKGCRPFEKALEQHEARARMLNAIGV